MKHSSNYGYLHPSKMQYFLNVNVEYPVNNATSYQQVSPHVSLWLFDIIQL